METTKGTKTTKERIEFELLSRTVIGCAIEVHRELGPGLLESAYQKCLEFELQTRGVQFDRELQLPVRYKEVQLDCGFRADFIIEERLILELKSVDRLTAVHEAQLLTYMKLSGCATGLLINFNTKRLRDGLKRFVL
jgi:GxxExxY protein